ncbi:MAG: GNAT family N-acetyltransferase [Anaerolineae bacterium]|nr:GNAT family N-acetyltransferase [Anaerolineae bacterium]
MFDDIETVIVRPVKPEDAAQLRDNCFSVNTLEQISARITEAIQTTAQETQTLLVAEVQDAQSPPVVVGTGSLVRNTHPLYAHRGELTGLVVHPHYQRQGIARRVVEAVCEQAAAWGIEILETGCRGGTPAEAVYPRLGFIEWGRLPGGIKEPYGEQNVYDDVSFYMLVRKEKDWTGG